MVESFLQLHLPLAKCCHLAIDSVISTICFRCLRVMFFIWWFFFVWWSSFCCKLLKAGLPSLWKHSILLCWLTRKRWKKKRSFKQRRNSPPQIELLKISSEHLKFYFDLNCHWISIHIAHAMFATANLGDQFKSVSAKGLELCWYKAVTVDCILSL